jgi:ferredoxin-NADP reductase/ferredoxin
LALQSNSPSASHITEKQGRVRTAQGWANLNRHTGPDQSARIIWSGFRSLRVVDMHRESENVLSFVFEAEDQSSLPDALAGQFLVFKIRSEGQAAPILRSYSISGPPAAGRYRISVKRGDGPGSQHFHDRVRAGDLLQVSAPRGTFTVIESDRPIVFLSAGIGATPVLSMLHALSMTAKDSARNIWWCYGARNGAEHPFKREVQNALARLLHTHSFVVYSKPRDQDGMGEDYDAVGRLELPSLRKLDVPQEADFYLCGPAKFLTDLSLGLKGWGVGDDRIHSEAFGSGQSLTPGIAGHSLQAPHPPAGPCGTGPTVSFTRSNLSVSWSPRYANLLEFAEACDVPVRWSCRVGVCHTCETGVINGQLKYQPEPLDKPAAGNALLCCGSPLSELELDL